MTKVYTCNVQIPTGHYSPKITSCAQGTPPSSATWTPNLRLWFDDAGELADCCIVGPVYSIPAADSTPPAGRTKKQPIPHADLIRAVLDGKTVQSRATPAYRWADVFLHSPRDVIKFILDSQCEFRIKPEPVVHWLVVDNEGDIAWSEQLGPIFDTREEAASDAGSKRGKVLRLELDAETLDVISATTEAP